MANLNYKNSMADRYVVSKTTSSVSEDISENVFNTFCLYFPLSKASANIAPQAYDSNVVFQKGYGIIKITSDNYEDIMLSTGVFFADWKVAFNEGANVDLILYVVLFDDTNFAVSAQDKNIEWKPLSKAFRATYNYSFVKCMFSDDNDGSVDVNYFDESLCLALLCQNDEEFSQFVSYVKLVAIEDLELTDIGEVNKDTEHLPSGANNGDYVVATGATEDFPYTIDGIEFSTAGQKAYYNSTSSSWGEAPAIADSNLCKILSLSRSEEVESASTLTGTSQTDRANKYWGFLNAIAQKTKLVVGNTIPLVPVLISKRFKDGNNGSGTMVGNILAFDRLTYAGLKPFGTENDENSEVNNNLSTFFFDRLLSKSVYFPVSISDKSYNDCFINGDKDISFYPVPAREIQKWIDYTSKNDIADWWANTKNVLCNLQTYQKIQNMVNLNVAKFVSADLLSNYKVAFPPFDQAKRGNSIVANACWSADYVNGLEKITITGVINVELSKEA